MTTGPIFSWARFKDMVDLNWRQRQFKDRVKGRQRLDAVVRANNPLFWTHAGSLDQNVIRSSGRPGYLVMGPGTPLGAGTFRVRWTGTVQDAQRSDLGWVEICHRDCREQLAKNSIAPDGETLAEVGFQQPREIRDVEFRMYVNEGSGVTLHSVAITQQ